MKRLHQANSGGGGGGGPPAGVSNASSGKRNHENGEVTHRVPQTHHHYAVHRTGGPTLVDFTPAKPHDAHDISGVRSNRMQQHMPQHHMAHTNRQQQVPPALSVNLKRPPPEDDDHHGVADGAKRNANEDSMPVQQRPPLTRGESLPAVPFVPDRQPNFKDKHPVRAPSFDTAFKPGGE